jgi:hypothetical protein
LCARLKKSADILASTDNTRLAAAAEAVNRFAATDAPFTPEMGASITQAIAANTSGVDTQLALAGEYFDAIVSYVAILNQELGWSEGDSVAFFIEKHGGSILETDDINLINYVQMRIDKIGG